MLLAAMILCQEDVPPRPPLEPELKIERTSLLTEMRSARVIQIRCFGKGGPPATRLFRRDDPDENGGATLVVAIESDFLRHPNASRSRCGFHTDLLILATGRRTLVTELCFGCGEIQTRAQDPRRPAIWGESISWAMVDRKALREEVRRIFPGAVLGKEPIVSGSDR